MGGLVPGLLELLEETPGRAADLVHRGVERLGVALRRRAVPAHFTHELESGGGDLLVGRSAVRAAEGLDRSAHTPTLAAPTQIWASHLTWPIGRRMFAS